MIRPPARRVWWSLPFALLFALQSWLWLQLRPLAQRALRWRIWHQCGVVLVGWLQRRPPWQAVTCMVAPVLLANSFKLICVYWTTQGHWFMAGAGYVVIKTLEFGTIALVEYACRPILRTVPLYRVIYLWIARVRRWTRRQLRPWRRWWSAVRAHIFSKTN